MLNALLVSKNCNFLKKLLVILVIELVLGAIISYMRCLDSFSSAFISWLCDNMGNIVLGWNETSTLGDLSGIFGRKSSM